MRFVILGAGGVGSVIGARLHLAGAETVLVARGHHGEVVRRDGLTLVDPDGERLVPVSCVTSAEEAAIEDGDCIVLTVKSQDTPSALHQIIGDHRRSIVVACAQNGVNNERVALRYFQHVLGVLVLVPTSFLEPGVVKVYISPVSGGLDVGAIGTMRETIESGHRLVGELRRAGFSSFYREDILRWKYAKLLQNIQNIVDVIGLPPKAIAAAKDAAVGEALACLEAAGIAAASVQEMRHRRSMMPSIGTIQGQARVGSSLLQSVLRSTGSVETDYINGEVVLLGRLNGVRTPVNEALQGVAYELARAGTAERSEALVSLRRILAAEPD